MMVKILREERGATIVLVALMATVLLGMVALVADYGMLSILKQRLENKCDAAALAGAQELPNSSSAVQKAQEYAVKNGLNTARTTITVSSDNKSISVSTYQAVPLSFARVFNITSSTVSAGTKATLAPVGKLSGVIPLGIQKPDASAGEHLVQGDKIILQGNNGNVFGSAFFGVLDFRGNSSKAEFQQDIRYGYTGSLSVGDIVSVDRGNRVGWVSPPISDRINSSPTGETEDNFDRSSPRVITVPVYIPNTYSGNTVDTVKIVGFAMVFIQGFEGKDIYGYVVKSVAHGDIIDSAEDYGAEMVHLTQY